MATDFDYTAAARLLDERSQQRSQRDKLLLERARTDFARITSMIATKYQPARIYQWGSLLNGEHFREWSDIDVAVEGLRSAEEFSELLRDAEALTDFPLDVVRLEKIDPLHAESIRRKGRKIYEDAGIAG